MLLRKLKNNHKRNKVMKKKLLLQDRHKTILMKKTKLQKRVFLSRHSDLWSTHSLMAQPSVPVFTYRPWVKPKDWE